MIDIKQIHNETQEVLRKRDECLRLLSHISGDFPDRNLMSSLREKVYAWYQPDINILEFKFDYVQQMMATPNNACTRPASAVGTGGESDESAGG